MRKFLFFILIIIFVLISCDQNNINLFYKTDKEITIMTWNLQNLMDAVDNGDEYEEYKLNSGWCGEFYRWRLKQVGKVIAKSGYPDILVFNEIENDNVLNDLCAGPLKYRGYGWYALRGAENSPISTAILSKYPIVNSKIHNVEGCRPVIEVRIKLPSEEIIILACHGKSNLEGKIKTEKKRLALSKTLNLVTDEIIETNPKISIFLAGDFNSCPEEWDQLKGNQPALIEKGKNLIWEDNGSLVLSGVKGRNCWYSFWLDKNYDFCNASYWWNGSWKSYDSIFCSPSVFDSNGLIFSGFSISSFDINTNADGTPRKWNKKIIDGISDHFPVLIILEPQS